MCLEKYTTITEALKNNGFAVVADIFTDNDLKDIKLSTEDLIKNWGSGHIDSKDFWNGTNEKKEKILYRIHNFENHYPKIKSITQKPEFKKLINSILGVNASPTVYALIIKMPKNGAAVPWHRDIENINIGERLNVSIYLDNSSPENGCFEAVPGTHGDDADYSGTKEPPPYRVFVPARPNDIIIHDVRLFHGSGPSKSESLRRSVVIEYKK